MATNADPRTSADSEFKSSDSLGNKVSEEISSAREEVHSIGSKVRDEAKAAAAAVRDKVDEGMASGKSALTGSLDDFSAAIRKASDELSERDQVSAAKLVREAAAGLERATEVVKGKNVREIAGSVATFARERPTMFFIGAALAGLALGRFARASSQHSNEGGRTRSQGDAHDY